MSINPFESSFNTYSSITNNAISKIDNTKIFDEFSLDTGSNLKTDKFLYSVNNISSANKQLLITSLETDLNSIDEEFKSAKNSNGWLSGAWDKFKDVTHIGAGSKKTQKEINLLKDSVKELKQNPDKFVETYKKVTGKELTDEDLTKLIKGEISFKDILKANESLTKYTEGQKMVTDVVGDIVSGIVSVGAVALGSAIGICAAPFTAGASLGLVVAGLGVGAAAGAAVKVGIKASDCIGNEKKYEIKDLGYDLITGSINGAMGPVSNAIGGATGTAVMKAMGMKSLETTAKNAVVKMTAQRVIATGADMVVDGAISGATDGFARALGEGRIDDIPKEMMTGAAGGAIAAPIIGGGFKVAGKAGSAAGHAIQKSLGKEVSENVGDVVAREISGEISEEVAEQIGKESAETVAGEVAEQLGKETSETVAGEISEQTGKEASETVGDKIVQNVDNKKPAFDIKDYPTSPTSPDLADPINHDLVDPINHDVNSNLKPHVDEVPDVDGSKVKVSDSVDSAKKSKIDAKIEELQIKSTKISTKEFTLPDGTTSKFITYEGTKGGSNYGYYVKNAATGELYYAKFAGAKAVGQSEAEVLSSKLYKLAGIDVPELTLVKTPDGKSAVLSKFIPDLKGVSSSTPLVHEGFGMDVLLANWDVAGAGFDNTVTDGSKIFRIDVGGTLDFRAQGDKKHFGAVVDELSSLLDTKINKQSAQIFSSMSVDDMIASIKKVTSISDDEIIKILKEEGMESYKDAILQRKAYLQGFVDIAEKTPKSSSVSLLDYTLSIKTQVTSDTISKAKTQIDIASIQKSIDNIQDPKVKQFLQKQLDDKSLAIKNAAKGFKTASQEDLIALLKKNGIKKGSNGKYNINLTSEFEQKVYARYGSSNGDQILYKLKQPLTDADLASVRKFMNVGNGKYVSYWENNPIDMLAYFRVLSANSSSSKSLFANFDKITDAQWAAIMNTVQHKSPSDVIDALSTYKGAGYASLNGALTDQKNAIKNKQSYTISPSIQSKIDKISAYIDTQAIPETMHVYRGEGTEVLASCKLNNGKTLEQAIQDIGNVSNPQQKQKLINELIEDVLDNNYEAIQERFMSTSLVGIPSGFEDKIRWDLELPAGTKGVFLEGANIYGTLNTEVEYLVQKGSKITITGIEYVPSSGAHSSYWKLKGSLVNN